MRCRTPCGARTRLCIRALARITSSSTHPPHAPSPVLLRGARRVRYPPFRERSPRHFHHQFGESLPERCRGHTHGEVQPGRRYINARVRQVERRGAAAAEPEAQKAVSTPNPEMRTVQMRRIENIMGKSSETLILTNGTRVQGVVIQQGMDYMVLTPEGRVFYSSAQVQGLEF